MKESRLLKSAGVVGALTLLSRLFGYFRDASLAMILGAGFSMDAFAIAFRLANLFRRLVGEGTMSASFVPVFTEYKEKNSARELWSFAVKFFYALSLFLAVLVAIQIVFAPQIVSLMSPGFVKSPGKWELTIFLNRLMAPYIFFVGLAALLMAILNSLGTFAVPAANPIFFNLALIGAAFGLSPWFDDPAVGVAIGVLVGGFFQMAVQVPSALRKGMNFFPTLSFNHPAIRKVLALMGPGFFGIGIVQINLLVDSIMASFLPEGSVSSIYYANRVEELALGVFTIALATVMLPEMSKLAARKNIEEMKEKLTFSLRMVSFVTIPASAGLIVLSQPIIQVLFEHGRFTSADTERAAFALVFYAVGLIFIAGVRIMVPAFFAVQDTKTPVRCAFVALLVNIAGNWILMHPLKQGGIALATSIAAAVNFFQLLVIYQKRFGPLHWEVLRESLIRIGIQGLAVALSCPIFIQLFHFGEQKTVFWQAAALFGTIGIGFLVYFGVALLLKSRELSALKGISTSAPGPADDAE